MSRHGFAAGRGLPAAIAGWRSSLRAEDGSSPVTAIGGVAMFLVFLLLATQTTVHLYAGSRAAALALEAATRGARSDDAAPCTTAIGWADGQLAGWDGMGVGCAADDETVEVWIRGPSPAPALSIFGMASGLDTLDRRALVRRETFR